MPQAKQTNPTNGKAVEYRSLTELEFDVENPRFGRTAREQRSQTEILDYIVRDFGIDDVLSSIAVNGFFVAEPLICREQDAGKRLTVVEGNRRLAACLILADDSRAKNQSRKVEQYRELQAQSGRPSFTEVPVICFGRHEREKDLLSYLGVRHIAASQGWDSYAKAAWIARAVESNDLTLREIALMTGDQHRTVKRLLEGFYFVNQLIDERRFEPSNSVRRGRGSNPEFPFSWIYTLLGYQPARQFLGLPDEPRSRPIPAEMTRSATLVVSAMFGDKSSGRSAAISDSREIGELAEVLGSAEKVALLERGKSVAEIDYETQPLDLKLRTALSDCKEMLSDLIAELDANPPSLAIAEQSFPLARQVSNLASSLAKRLHEMQAGLQE
jgi:hypothetical protein